MKKNLLLMCFALVCNILAVQSQNLLANPGFETWAAGRPNGWTTTNTANLAQNTIIFNEGTMSCKVNATMSDFNIYQIVAVTPGKVYTLKVSYYIELGDGTDAKLNCYFRNSANAAIKMSLEDSLALKGPGGNSAYFPNVLGSWQTYTYDVVAPAGASTFLFYFRVARYGTVSWDNCSFSVNSNPTVYTSKTTLTGFTYAPGSGPSAEQTLNVRANNITGLPLVVTAPAHYEISALPGVSFVGTNSITIASTAGSVTSTPIYIRLKAGYGLGSFNENLTVAAGSTTKNVLLTGTVAVPPVVINSSVTTLTGFTYAETAGPSAQKSFTVSGSGLTGGMVITAPSNYEISVISNAGFTSPSITLTPTNGTLATTTIYIRLKSGLIQGTYNGNLTVASVGGTAKTITLTGNVTATAGLAISKTSLIGFSYGLGAGPSPEQSFTVSGNALTTFIIVTTPTAFEISTGSGALFAGTNYLILPQAGTLTTLYVRLMSGYPVSTYTGNISLTSGAYTKTLSLNGNVLITTGTETANTSAFKAYGNGNDLIIEGTTANELVHVYNLVGQQIKSIQSKGERLTIPLKAGSVYLVRSSSGITKVIM